MKWLTERQWRLSWERVGEAAREFGLLWLVFSLLDKIVDGTITLPWIAVNACISVALWFSGMYIELRWMKENE